MSRIKESLTILKVFWTVWVWEEMKEGARLYFKPLAWFFRSFAIHLGIKPCCDNPDLQVAGNPRYVTTQECLSCGYTRTFSVSWPFFP